jgi:uncharacterized protein YbbC (DUF1343 family)
MKFRIFSSLIIAIAAITSCVAEPAPVRLTVGAEHTEKYLPLLKGRRVGVVSNHTGMVESRHLVDTLLALGVDVELVFAPEHGFRGTATAGEHIDNTRDGATGLEIVSLYGANRKPRAADIERCDVMIFDIQDVGCRFYTYLSTLHYVMEACAESGVPLVVLDRPNPNGMYVDGPILDTARHRSFVGMHPIPVVHGMTLGELAGMINGEKWLAGGVRCDLTVIPCEGYTRDMRYELPTSPSPALPNMRAVYLYPSLCYFEATAVSLGRGTDAPFQVLTYPDGTVVDLRVLPADEDVIAGGIDLSYLIDAYSTIGNTPGGKKFLSSFFENLIGVDWVREMIETGCSAAEIRTRWTNDVEIFKQQRTKYLIYE